MNETEINSLSDKKFKAFVTKMLTVLGERIYLRSNIFNKELENIFKKTPIRNEEFFG